MFCFNAITAFVYVDMAFFPSFFPLVDSGIQKNWPIMVALRAFSELMRNLTTRGIDKTKAILYYDKQRGACLIE